MTVTGEAALHEGISDLLHSLWGNDTRIESYDLLSRRSASVARVRLSGPEPALAPATVVVKHVAAEDFPLAEPARSNPEFAEEQLAQRFLREIGLEGGLKPALLAWDRRGITILEDLGERNYTRPRTYEELIPLLSDALARLHAGSSDRFDTYLRMRHEAGLGEVSDDTRRYGAVAQARRFEKGRAFVLEQRPSGRRALEAEIDSVRSQIDEPGSFRAFIHDDLANARQTFEVGDSLYLLDFEYSRYSHCLLDLCKPMIGKFEINLDTNTYVWTCPNFPLELASTYRRHLDNSYGWRFSDHLWEEGLSVALIYTALTLIGRLVELEPEVLLFGSIQQNINGILFRLAGLLQSKTVHPEFQAFISRFLDFPL
jgi:hypothetical protein